MNLEQRIKCAKSKLVAQVAKALGYPVINIKMSKADPMDLIGRGTPLNQLGSEVGTVVKLSQVNIDRKVEAQMASREIHPGDMVLMEYARGVVENVVVESIDDGMVYALGEDGEPFCAPLENCDKIPF